MNDDVKELARKVASLNGAGARVRSPIMATEAEMKMAWEIAAEQIGPNNTGHYLFEAKVEGALAAIQATSEKTCRFVENFPPTEEDAGDAGVQACRDLDICMALDRGDHLKDNDNAG